MSASNTTTSRDYFFHVKPASIPFGEQTLPSETQIHRTWPKKRLRVDLPESILAVAIYSDDGGDLIGPPIHVLSGDRLKLTLKNDVKTTGLSLHLHGLGFGGKFEYAGAVGVSQCPLAEGNQFVYDVVVADGPGTYWYHTSSGHLGLDASVDAVRGPLIVHPTGSEELVDILNGPSLAQLGYSPLAYAAERILFLQDGFLTPAASRYTQQKGGLMPPPSKSDDGTIVATAPWQFGTCNGKLRSVIHVASNQKIKFHVINGGQHHALRFSIDGFPLTVVAADAQPVEAYTVDEIVLHVGERFDVEVFVYKDIREGERFWIRADTLESQDQGFENGIRAILRVSDPQSIPQDEDVPDPIQDIAVQPSVRGRDRKILNCHSLECIPITSLTPLGITQVEANNMDSEIHTVDTHFQPVPQHAHFVSIDDSLWVQNELPPAAMISRTFRPEKSVHPHSMALRVSRSSSIIVVWRTTLLMDVPIHLHGHVVEILDIAQPASHDCNIRNCRLSGAYENKARVKALDKQNPPNHAIKKDTFVIPAGGAIVTRMRTGNRGLWMVNGQKDVHSDDGMSFVMIVGDYRIPRLDDRDDWPADFPTCNSTLVASMPLKPHCRCYVDKNAPAKRVIPTACSRTHLCHHERSQAANLDSYVYNQGFNIQSGWGSMPSPVSLAIFLCIVFASVALILVHSRIRSRPSKNNDKEDEPKAYGKVLRRLSLVGVRSRLPERHTGSIVNVNIRGCSQDSSILGLSVVPSEHIGTVEHIDEEEEEEDVKDSEEEDEGSHIDADLPPPPPPPPPHPPEREIAGNDGPPLPFMLRINSRASSGDLFRSRRSTTSTFDRVFSERGIDGEEDKIDLRDAFDILLDGFSVNTKVEIAPVDKVVHRGSPFAKQLLFILPIQWQAYFPSSVNPLRMLEVFGLATLTGAVFRSAVDDGGQAGISELSSLVLVLTTMWTFARLYAAVSSHHDWFQSIQVVFQCRRFSLMPVVSARIAIVGLCESAWPIASTFVCLAAAGLLGDARAACNVAFLLGTHNLFHVSLGAALGMFAKVPQGIVAATIFGQVSIVISGVFSQLPDSLEWARNFSPFYWTVRGLLKSVHRWSDTYECLGGSGSDVGANRCFVGDDPVIEQYRSRGLPVATYRSSEYDVLTETLALVALTFGIHAIIFGRCFFAYYKVNWDELNGGRPVA
ncbi:hypothetical protein ACHAWF_015207 [Thalassiosira exigua]